MARGPKPQPTAIKLAKGNPGRRRVGSDAALTDVAASGSVAAPEWLKGAALEIWNQRAPGLVRMRLLSATDTDAFARYCVNFARWLKMQARLDSAGEFYEIETAAGLVRRPDPSFMVADRLERSLSATEDRFGLNPAERQRIMAARANAAALGDLFAGQVQPQPQKGKSQPQPTESAPKAKSPIGMLQ